MKRAKYFIYLVVLAIQIIVLGEVNLDTIKNSGNGTNYICFDTGDKREWEHFCKAFSQECTFNDVTYFTIKFQQNNITEGNFSIYTDFIELENIDLKLENAEYKSMFSGKVTVEILPFCDIYKNNDVMSSRFYMVGSSEKITRIYNNLNNIYGTSRVRVDSNDISEEIIKVILVVGVALILIMTLFDIAFQKKQVFIRISLGEAVGKIVIANIIRDIVAFASVSFITCCIICFWISPAFYILSICKWVLIVSILNSCLYISLYRISIKQALSLRFQNKNLVFYCYVLQLVVMLLTLITSSIGVEKMITNRDFVGQYSDINKISNYSFLDFKYYELTPETSKEYYRLAYSMFKDGYERFDIAFSVESVDFDDITYINVNDNANALLEDIKEIKYINEKLKVHILLPFEYRENVEKYLDNALQSGRCICEKADSYPYEVIYYKNADVLFFNQDLENISSLAHNPVICYFTGLSAEDFNVDSTDGFPNMGHEFRTLLFNVNDDQISNLTSEFRLPEKGFYLMTENVKEKYEITQARVLREIFTALIVSLIMLITGVFLIGVIIGLEFYERSQETAIKTVLGYGVFTRNKEIIVSSLFIWLVAYVACIVLSRMVYFAELIIILGLGIVIVVINGSTLLFHVYRTERRNIVKTLKGGAL